MWTRTIIPLGDRALTIEFPAVSGSEARDLLRSLTARVARDDPVGVTALVPAIRALTLHYEPARTTYRALEHYIGATLDTLVVVPDLPREPVVIPVCYGGDFGPDLEDVARTHDTSVDAIVAAHTAGTYTVAMLGFLPGFPYLDGLDTALHTPRRATPRTAVPAGSVGIGGSSTGVYPFVSPGGWHLIGRTPMSLFAAERATPTLLQPGDRVHFRSISMAAFRTLAART